MNRKSKFIVFILSFLPGLSHFYLGAPRRGSIFMALTVANILITITLQTLFGYTQNEFLWLLLGLPVIWLVAFVDSISLAERINAQLATGSSPSQAIQTSSIDAQAQEHNKKMLACLFSIVPGAGHMYLGYQQEGLELMTLFFFSLFLIDWMRISLFMFVIPVIWFFSMFDALSKAGENGLAKEDKQKISLLEFIAGTGSKLAGSKILGYALVIIGTLMIFDRIITPLIGYPLSYYIRSYFQTGIVSFLFIYGGIRILLGSKKQKPDNREVEQE